MMKLLVFLCCCLLNEVYCDQKDIWEKKLRDALEGSTLLKYGLQGMVKPENPGKYEELEIPTPEIIKKFQAAAEDEFDEITSINKKLNDTDTTNEKTPGFSAFQLTSKTSLKIHEPGFKIASITKDIVNEARKGDPGKERILNAKTKFEIFDLLRRLREQRPFPFLPVCPFEKPIKCNATEKYRTIDGSCNNLLNPYWGKSHTPFERYLVPEYDGGISNPRKFAKSSNLLPSPRKISTAVHELSNNVDLNLDISYMVMQWGQFTDHDLTFTAKSKGYAGRNLQCCGIGSFRSDCFPIHVPVHDVYYWPLKPCLNFVRSTATPALDCNTDYRHQLNELTQYLDGSMVYGSTKAELNKLRDGNTEFMKTSNSDLLPLDVLNLSGCQSTSAPPKECFIAGDKRGNVQPGLSAMHTIWVREHNRIATIIGSDNPGLTQNEVFEEARRFVGAEIQHITYSEFLPRLLPNLFMVLFGLKPKSAGHFFGGYDETVKPMIRNGFATAAYRFGHSLLRDLFRHQALHKRFNNPDLLYQPLGVEQCSWEMYDRLSQDRDRKMTEEVRDKLFKTDTDLGTDLAAMNIQRGRDHGIPVYNEWLNGCFGRRAEMFDNLTFHSAEAKAKLSNVYEHPDDIDLFTGAVSEEHIPGTVLGPTMACIIALQFKSLKDGDRFYYEGNTVKNPHPFEIQQLDSIRKITLGKVICDNTQIEWVPRNVFLKPSATNPFERCSDLPSLTLPCNNWVDSPVKKCEQHKICNNKIVQIRTNPKCLLTLKSLLRRLNIDN